MIGNLLGWAPAGMLAVGSLLTLGVNTQQVVPLRAPLETTIPTVIQGMEGRDIEISEEEQRIAGMSNFVMRVYEPAAGQAGQEFSLYTGYYENQTGGRTIHSPKNCLPGAGWEALTASTAQIATAGGSVTVNRYLLQNGAAQALVLYWYQGRGRIEANEYVVKWDLLRDAALHGRSEEALVRLIVPVTSTEAEAFERATRIAQTAIPAVEQALPS